MTPLRPLTPEVPGRLLVKPPTPEVPGRLLTPPLDAVPGTALTDEPAPAPPLAAPGVLADEPQPLAANRVVNPNARVNFELGVTMIASVALIRGF
ncbi:MAG TPA: hypothetical protein VNV38_07295 [Stellaceae bacterium]|nr:hypothetical protein [Stellaceae bacterium]